MSGARCSLIFLLSYRQFYLSPLTAHGTIGYLLEKRDKKHIFASAERGKAQAFPLFAFLGLTILYERKNYKQARKNFLLDSFYEVLESEKYLDSRKNYLGANLGSLNYP